MERLAKKSTTAIAIIIIVFLLLMIASFASAFLLQISGLTKLNGKIFLINRLLIWVVLIFVWLYVKYVEKQKLLIWPEIKHSVAFYILSVIIILVILFIGNIVFTKMLSSITHNEVSAKFLAYIEILKTNIPLLIFTAFTAAIVEEIIFRGFIQTRLQYIFNSPVAGILISSLLFALVHVSYGTLSQFIIPFFIGLVFSFFYWKYKNLKVLIVCHFLWDGLALFLSIHAHQ